MDDIDVKDDGRLYPSRVVAAYLGMTQLGLRVRVHRGLIQARREGHKWYFEGCVVHAYKRNMPIVEKTKP